MATETNLKTEISLTKFLTIEIIVSAIINGGFGALFGWLLGRGVSSISFSGTGGLVTDILATCFITGFLTVLIVTPIMRGRIRQWDEAGGKPNVVPYNDNGVMKLVPQNLWLRALATGLAAMVVLGSTMLAVVNAAHITPLMPQGFIRVKSLYGACIGGVLTPFIMLPMLAGRIR